MRQYGIKALKLVLRVFAVLVILAIVVGAIIQLSYVQTKLITRITDGFSKRTGSEIAIERVAIRFSGLVALKGIYLEDEKGDTLLYVREVGVKIRLMSLLNNHIHVKRLNIKGLTANLLRVDPDTAFNYDFLVQAFSSGKSANSEEVTLDAVTSDNKFVTDDNLGATSPWTFALNALRLEEVQVHYIDYLDGIDVKLGLTHLKTSLLELDPTSSLFHFGSTTIQNIYASLSITEPAVPRPDKEPGTDLFPDIDLAMLKLNIDGMHLDISTNSGEPDVFDLHVAAKNILMRKDTAGLEIMSASGKMMDKIQIANLSSHLAVGRGVSARDLIVETSDSRIKANLIVGTGLRETKGLLAFSAEGLGNTYLDVDIESSILGRDLISYMSENQIFIDVFDHHEALRFEGSFSGPLNEIDIGRLAIAAPGLFELTLDGQVSGLPDVDRTRFVFPAIRLTTDTEAWKHISGLDDVANQYHLPASITTAIYFDGTYNDFITHVDLKTDLGAVSLSGFFRDLPGHAASYEAAVEMDGVHLGTIMGVEVVEGGVSGILNVNGSGLSLETMELDLDVNITEALVNQYLFKDLSLKGAIYRGTSTFEAFYHDENLSFTTHGDLTLKDEHPRLQSSFELLYLDGLALHLTKDPFLLKTSLFADLIISQNDFYDGMVQIHHTDLLFGGQSFVLDSLVVVARSPGGDGSTLPEKGHADQAFSLEVRSSIFAFDYKGNISPLDVQAALGNHIISYFDSTSEAVIDDGSDKQFDFSFTVHPSEWYTEVLLPAMKSFDAFSFEGGFDGATGVLNLQGLIPTMTYSGVALTGMNIYSVTDLERASFTADMEMISVSGMVFNEITIEAMIEDHTLVMSLLADKETAVPWLVARGDLSELIVVFQNSDLEDFSARDAMVPVSGIVDGKVVVNDVTEDLSFTADLTINRFGLSGDTLGDVMLKLGSQDVSLFSFDASIRNYGNQLEAIGFYSIEGDPAIDMRLTIERLELSALEVFTSGEIQELEGIAIADVRIWGQPSSLDYAGSLSVKDARFLASFVNVYYSMPDETILFERDRINFSSFSVFDHRGRRAALNGTINTASFTNPVFDLSLTSENFLALQLDPGQNELFSGRVLINSNLRLRGDLQRPVIDGSLRLNEGSSLLMNMPQPNPDAIGDEGIVLFLDPDSADMVAASGPEPAFFSTTLSNLDVSINVEVDPKTDLRINIDEYAGDYLSVRGGGMISYGTDPGGRISLSGRYELMEGTYLLTFYDVLSRQFGIVQGSNLMWTGDPMNPNVDIRAVYTIRTSARELFETAAGAGEQSDKATRQTFTFQVFLEMKGSLNAPEISFRMGLPLDQRNALDGRLQSRLDELNRNESELNKQVFALLTIGGFIPENPFDTGQEGPGISSAARASASRLLTQQLNRLSDQYIRGVDIHFDIESYEDFSDAGYQGRTQLNLEVSKNFFDERLRFTVGGNIELEDESRRNTSAGDIAGDFSIEYLLTPSGNLVLKGFRKKEFGDLFEGQVIETGAALIYNRTYNRLKELFGRKNDDEL